MIGQSVGSDASRLSCFLFRPRKSFEKRKKRSHTNASNASVIRVSTPPAQTAHVRFHGRKRVHTRLCSKDRTQRLTRRNGALSSPGHSVVLCCQRNCHRKNSRRKWMHALRRASASSGVAAPQGCGTFSLITAWSFCATVGLANNRNFQSRLLDVMLL